MNRQRTSILDLVKILLSLPVALAILFSPAAAHAAYSQPEMVKDINQASGSTSSMSDVVTLAGITYFRGNDAIHGTELWKTDGTEAGTVMVKDIRENSIDSDPMSLTVFNNMVYFVVDGADSGYELWKTDGTEAGTSLITTDILYYSEFIVLNSTLIFGCSTASTGMEICATDGTAAGTSLVKDITPGSTGSLGSPYFSGFAVMGDAVYFGATTSTNVGLWKTDGTEAGTVLVKDYGTFSNGNQVSSPLAIGSTLYFRATEPTTGHELWKSDGTEAGTVLVKDISPGAASGLVYYIRSDYVVIGSTFYFGAFDGTHGFELWKSDGTEAGTTLVKDVKTGTDSGMDIQDSELVALGSTIFFKGSTVAAGTELWKSDGTEVGTVLVEDIVAGSGHGFIGPSTVVNSMLYFVGYTVGTGAELWKSDGTEAGTELVKDILSGGNGLSPYWYYNSLEAAGNSLIFIADDGTYGSELWKSDGTEAGTTLLKDINSEGTKTSVWTFGNYHLGEEVVFSATDGIHGRELWKSDGTADGTIMIKDISTGMADSSPELFTTLNNVLYFVANDGTNGLELWKSDGTEAGTALIKDMTVGITDSYIEELYATTDTVFFTYKVSEYADRQLWKTDGTEAGTVLVKDVAPLIYLSDNFTRFGSVGNTLYFSAVDAAGYELWKSDGTTDGTTRIKDINEGGNNSSPHSFFIHNSMLYFVAQDGTHGSELWSSDGTEAGTALVKDVFSGTSNGFSTSSGTDFVSLGSFFYFSANDGVSGEELWRSDGTEAGTTFVKDIYPGSSDSNIDYITLHDDILYFKASHPDTLEELWRSDGTEAGTYLLKDFYPNGSGYPYQFVSFAGSLMVTPEDPVYGNEVWMSDGTSNGTVLLYDFDPGQDYGIGTLGFATSTTFFMTADDGIHGTELWVTRYTPDLPSASGTGSNGSSTRSGAKGCTESTKPAPDLFEIRRDETSAQLFFTPTLSSPSLFYIAYGLSQSAEEHGTSFLAPYTNGVVNYMINSLSPSSKYFFKVRTQNGCMPGDWSQVLETTTTNSGINRVVQPAATPTPATEGQIKPETPTSPVPTPEVADQPGSTPVNTIPATPVVTTKPASISVDPTFSVTPVKKCFLWVFCY